MAFVYQCGFYVNIVIFSISFLSECSGATERSIAPEAQRKIDDYINNVYLPSCQIFGMGLTILQNDGEILYTTGYGLADREKGIPNGNSTQFLIGSVTKSFTSLLVAKLLHEKFPNLGEAVLDTPIRKLLPQANFTSTDRFRSEHATFRDLLAHRFCFNREDVQLMADPFDNRDEIVYRTRFAKERCGFREKFQYSNQMYVVAGELAALLVNKSYEDAIQDLLNDIGMSNSSFTRKTDNFSQMPYRAMPYYVKDNETLLMNSELVKRVVLYNAAGGLFATPDDMAKYMRFHLNLGSINGKQIVPKEVMEWLTTQSNIIPSSSFKKSDGDLIANEFGYGLGLMLATYDGWLDIHHGGYFPPYNSIMALYPDKKLGIFASTNMGPVNVDMDVLRAFIFEVMRGSENPTEQARKLKESIDQDGEHNKNKTGKEFKEFCQQMKEKALAGNLSFDIVGMYGNGSTGEVDVSEKFNMETNQTEYYLQYGKWYKGWLQPYVEDVVFKLNYDTDLIQDDYADGRRDGSAYVAFDNDLLIFFTPAETERLIRARFTRNVRLSTLPVVPWNPGNCGLEEIIH